MADRPSAYRTRYQPIQFSGCGAQGQKSIDIKTYISGDVMSGNGFATKAYKDLYRFLTWTDRYAEGANGAAKHYYFTSTDFLHAGDLRPISLHYCPLGDIRQCFQGKGTPARFARVLKVCDYYLRNADIDISKLGWGRRVTDLQEYVGYYIGLDCNGFVGAYLEENFPGSGIAHNIDIDSFGRYFQSNATGVHFSRIDDPKLIKRSDILVRSKIDSDPDAKTRHIALVDDVLDASKTQAKLVIVESTGGSGLSSRAATLVKIEQNKRGRNWKLGNREYDAVMRSK